MLAIMWTVKEKVIWILVVLKNVSNNVNCERKSYLNISTCSQKQSKIITCIEHGPKGSKQEQTDEKSPPPKSHASFPFAFRKIIRGIEIRSWRPTWRPVGQNTHGTLQQNHKIIRVTITWTGNNGNKNEIRHLLLHLDAKWQSMPGMNPLSYLTLSNTLVGLGSWKNSTSKQGCFFGSLFQRHCIWWNYRTGSQLNTPKINHRFSPAFWSK